MHQLALEANQFSLAAAAAVSAGTAVTGETLDMQGFDSIVFFCTIATANAGNYLKAQQGDESDGSDAADLEGSATVAAANGDIVILEVVRPTKRYLTPVVIRAGANTATGDLYAIRFNAQFKGGAKPTIVDNEVADVIVSNSLIAPDEGTP